MRPRHFPGALFIVFLTGVLTVAAPSQNATGTPEGKPAKELLGAILPADAARRRALVRESGRRPADLVTAFLAEAARVKDTKDRVAILRLVEELAPLLGRELTPGSERAADALIGFLEAAGREKLKIGEAIRKPRSRAEASAAIALGALAPYVDEARERVHKALENEVRHHYGFHVAEVLQAYYRSYVDVNASPKEIAEKLGHDVSYVRATAAEALGARGREARDAIPALVDALEGSHPRKVRLTLGDGWSGQGSCRWVDHVKRNAARALVRIAPADKRAIPAHVRIVQKEKDPALLIVSLRHVGALSVEGKRALPQLTRLVQHKNARVAAEAVTAIGMIGIGSEGVLEALEKASKRKEKGVAARAAATLRMLARDKR